MPPTHSADSNPSYERSNDESLHLAHYSRSPHQLTSGVASDYRQHSCNAVALPQITGASTQYPASLYPGQTQSTYQSSPASPAALGYFPPLNFSFTLPQIPSPHPVPFQITVQPSFGVGNVPQLNISINLPQIPSAVPHSSFPTWPGQLQIQNQSPSEPALGNVLQSTDQNRLDQIPSGSSLRSASTSVYPGQTHSTVSQSFNTAFGNGQQLYDYSVPTQVPHSVQEQQYTSQRLEGGLVSTSEICTSCEVPFVLQNDLRMNQCIVLAMGSGQSQTTKLPSLMSVSGSSTLSSRLGFTNETDYLSPNDSGSRLSPVYSGQHQSTYQPSADPAFCREQMDDHSTLYQAQGAGIEHSSHAPQELNNDMGLASEVYPFHPTPSYPEESQSTYTSSVKRLSDYPFESSVSEMSNSALGSVNQDDSFSPNYLWSHSCEGFNILAEPAFQQGTSPRDMTSSLKRAADEIYPSWDILCQSATALSFEGAPRPCKRLKEADIGFTSCVPEEWMQSLAATPDDRDPHNPESFPNNGCRISHDQRMDLPGQSERSIDRFETQTGTSVLHGARNFRISGNPTFTNIGVNQVTNHSGPHGTPLRLLSTIIH
ncbi:hypothetical protein M378DRAFT_15868 [Amanita muscaria Koide BX008]|uniref:Uncharacterized protein n=1 Tax=Amanita muscaria (strain Koide BX008) TaxID=946122 RepID=A0A0C2WP68_AMAMK|nr:hypothetical protein M378DRAFT_15868 [Amanita muscaria Koide BX008]